MRTPHSSILFLCGFVAAWAAAGVPSASDGWISLFDGHTLNGWKTAETPASVRVEDGAIVTNGTRAHLFYVGNVENHDFTNFEFTADVKTLPGSNAGIYFHTRYQEKGWPTAGYEVQVNNSHHDPVRTGSLYHVRDVTRQLVPDGKWFTLYLMVLRKRILITVNGTTTVDYTEPKNKALGKGHFRRGLSSGTFALQAHDPKSTVFFKNLAVRLLPKLEDDFPLVDYHIHLKGGLTLPEALAISKRRGVMFGIAMNCGVGFPVTDDAGALAYIEKLKGSPCYIGMQAEGREWLTLFSREVIAKFDYVFTDSMTFRDDKGRRMRLWVPREVVIDDKQHFMDMLVKKTAGILNNEPIDIYVNPTYLPRRIAREYDTLWTDKRMDTVIAAAVKNNVAIEINAKLKLPSETFIKRAKAAGATFTFGTNNGGKDLGELLYSLRMVRACGITKDDMFRVKPDGKKPIQVRGS